MSTMSVLQITLPRKNDNTGITSFEPNIPIPKIHGKWKDTRKRERTNYIPHPTPTNSNRRDWHNAYQVQLMDMCDIMANTIDEMYPKSRIRWGVNENVAHHLSRLVYHCSSKYITPYLDLPWEITDEIENESNEIENESNEIENESKGLVGCN